MSATHPRTPAPNPTRTSTSTINSLPNVLCGKKKGSYHTHVTIVTIETMKYHGPALVQEDRAGKSPTPAQPRKVGSPTPPQMLQCLQVSPQGREVALSPPAPLSRASPIPIPLAAGWLTRASSWWFRNAWKCSRTSGAPSLTTLLPLTFRMHWPAQSPAAAASEPKGTGVSEGER